jgi:glycosyltransferase involved in cell wall biosynthesis
LWYGRDANLIFLQDPVSAGLPTTLANLFLRKRLVLKIVGDYAWEQAVQIKDFSPRANPLRRESRVVGPLAEKLKIPDGFVNLDEFYPFRASNYPLKIRLHQKIQSWVAKRADSIITPSEYLKRIVTKWGIEEEKINVVYNAVQLPPSVIPRFNRGIQKQIPKQVRNDIVESPVPPSSRLCWAGKPENDNDRKYFTIISVGRLVPWKGYEGLIEAFVELTKNYSNLKLKIVGEGPQMSNIQFLISKFNLDEKIQLLGSLSHEKTLEEIANADLFVLNSAYEGLSHVVLEALAVGTPVITTTAGGNPEVIKNEWNGILVKYNDLESLKLAMIKMIEDDEFREKCVKNGFQSLEKFREEEMVQRTLEVLRIPNS